MKVRKRQLLSVAHEVFCMKLLLTGSTIVRYEIPFSNLTQYCILNHQKLVTSHVQAPLNRMRSFQCAMFRWSRIVVRSSVVVLREILFCSFSSFFGFAACYGILVSNARLLALFLETKYTQSGQSRDEKQVVHERQVKNGNSGLFEVRKIFLSMMIVDGEQQKREYEMFFARPNAEVSKFLEGLLGCQGQFMFGVQIEWRFII